MTTTPRRAGRLRTGAIPLAAAAIALPLLSAPAHASPGAEAPDHVEDGATRPVFDYADAVREHVTVEAPIDSDGDGDDDEVRVDIIRPAGSGPAMEVPTIIVESPYFDNAGRGNEGEHKAYGPDGEPITFPLYYDNYFVPRGYAVAHVDMIGTANSTGCPQTGGPADILGGKAVIDWLNGRADARDADGGAAAADWSTGTAGMIGKSYDGTLANAVAATGVDGLETIVPISAISSWYDYSRANGLVNYNNYASYLARFVDIDPPEDCAHVREAMDEAADDATGNYNDHWAERDYVDGTTTRAENVRASVFIAHTVNDLNVQPDHFSRWWRALGEAGVQRKLWLGQYAHVEPFDFRRGEWVEQLHRWFDHELYGVDNGILDEPAVDVQVGPDEWITEDVWPARGPERTLRPGPDGSLGVRPAVGRTAEFTDTRMSEAAMVADLDEEHPGRLAFVSGPLRTDMRLSGTPTADLRVKVDRPEANLTVLLVDLGETERVDHNGREGGIVTLDERTCHGRASAYDDACYLITETATSSEPLNIVARGWTSAEHRDSLSDPSPMPVGEYTDIEWDTLPQDYVFERDHRMALVIAGTDQSYLPSTSATGATVTVDLRRSGIGVPMRPFGDNGHGGDGRDASLFGSYDADRDAPSDVDVPVQPRVFE